MLGVFVHVYVLSRVHLPATPWTVVPQGALCVGFPRQEYWIRLPFPPPRDLPNPGIKTVSLASPALAGGFLITALLGKPSYYTWPYHREKEQQHSCGVHGRGHEGSHQDMAKIQRTDLRLPRWGRMDWEFGISRWKLLYIEWINNKVLLFSTRNYV